MTSFRDALIGIRAALLNQVSQIDETLGLIQMNGAAESEGTKPAPNSPDKPTPQTGDGAMIGGPKDSGFRFGKASLKELEGVDSRLVECVHLALRLSTQDFTVHDGLRTYKEQEQHVRNGTSKTMQSKHLEGLAVDLVPYINGKLVWDWAGCYKIAKAMDDAATQLGIAHLITWGGAWDRKLSDFGGDVIEYKRETELYASRRGGKAFLDGPHFEILK